MKTLKFINLVILFFYLISCDKNDIKQTNNPEVETFIGLLRSNQYNSLNLPAFSYNDIEALLQYRNETKIITNFPHNPVSSLYVPDCKLGLYVLWTIESIRAVSIKSEYLIMSFPSQNPILALRNSDELNLVSDNLSHSITADAYYYWWEVNKGKNFNEFKNIDPLKKTDYKWH